MFLFLISCLSKNLTGKMGKEKGFVAYSERERKHFYHFEAGVYGGGFWPEV